MTETTPAPSQPQEPWDPGAGLSRRAKLWVPAVLVGAVAVNISATDFYAPSMAHLPEYFSTSPELVYMTMSVYFLALCLGQLVHGPLTERFGRRRLLLLGYGGFVFFSLCAGSAPTIHALLAARAGQALCGGVTAVAVVPTIRALFREEEALKIMGYFGLAVGLAPALAPVFGGFVYILWGWRPIFFIIALAALGTWFLIHLLVPETVDLARARPLSLAATLADYRSVLARREALAVMLPTGFGFGGFFAFIAAGPFVLINRLGVPTERYGFHFMLMVFSYMFGSFLVTRLAGRGRTPLQLFRYSVLLAPLGGATVLLPVLFGLETVASVMAGVMIFAFFLGFLLASAPLAMLAALAAPPAGGAKDAPAAAAPAGVAMAVLYAIQFGGAALGGGLAGGFQNGSAAPFAWTLAGLSGLGALAAVLLGRPRRSSQGGPPPAPAPG